MTIASGPPSRATLHLHHPDHLYHLHHRFDPRRPSGWRTASCLPLLHLTV
ncbi:MAG TPA: hypothetical protein VFV33_16325 [Gemmatimonadaceae bacterium]|nr:hypothetical protein [Gemmatimonadaceae bacterium]